MLLDRLLVKHEKTWLKSKSQGGGVGLMGDQLTGENGRFKKFTKPNLSQAYLMGVFQ